MTTVYIRHLRLSSELRSPNPSVTRLIKDTVPVSGREYDSAERMWRVYASRVSQLLEALREAGFDVVEKSAPQGGER